jgi:hypothetical protein
VKGGGPPEDHHGKHAEVALEKDPKKNRGFIGREQREQRHPQDKYFSDQQSAERVKERHSSRHPRGHDY